MRDVTLPYEEAKLVAKVAHAAAIEHPSTVGRKAIAAIDLVVQKLKEAQHGRTTA